jgi:PAS domain S-box-containing protein
MERANDPSDPTGAQPEVQPDREAQPVDTEQPPRLAFPVVGIGASAGGLEALSEFLDAMPSDSGMAFVLSQHLSPDRESMMAEILARRTKMTVAEVEDGMPVEPDHVYVIRPGHVLTIREGRLHLGLPLGTRATNRPIDDFFKSLAEEQRERGIAIIMSGMGSNGAAGAQAIKAVGGLCIAQDPETAQFPSMPRHLIDQGYADYILPPGEMPDVLLSYAAHPYVRENRGAGQAPALRRDQNQLREILAILRTRTRQDFSGYKKPTILRRVQRRMGLTRVDKTGDYAKLLRQSPSEVTALADDLLIHVTGFFRDAEAWEALRERVIAPLVAAREPEAAVRCWVTACSSGEEAYTLAILLVEESERAGKRLDIKVFATDMADRALGHARAGVYPGGIESEVSAERLDRFFEKDDAVYRVQQDLRERVVFAPQNLLQDPPFSRLDIASCRNLLIYLEPDVQQRVLALLHFGLREGGALFLGGSETIAGAEDLFEPIDKRARIFRRLGPTRHGLTDFALPRALQMLPAGSTGATAEGTAPDAELADAAAFAADSPRRVFRPERRLGRPTVAQVTHRTLLEHHTPAAVTIDRDHRVLYFHGNTRPFLEQPSGEPTRDLLMLTRDGLRAAVRQALQRAASEGTTATVMDGWVELEPGRRGRIAVSVSPVSDKTGPDYFVVSFQERGEIESVAGPTDGNGDGDGDSEEIAQSNRELRRVRDELQTTIEELQTSNEELKASHEEVMSMNEELQSANEELETSKEEMQSLNEELTTVNAQLRAKMEELQVTSNDLTSLLASTDLAVLFLDTRFRIRRYTPPILDLIELIATDVGRPLSDLARKFTDPQLVSDAEEVLGKLAPLEREVEGRDCRWFMRRITPYRTSDNRIDGIVVTFHDITLRRRAESAMRASEQRMRNIINVEGVGVLTFDASGTLIDANDAFLHMSGYQRDDIVGRRPAWRTMTRQPGDAAAGERQLKLLRAGERIGPYEAECLHKDGTRSWMLFAGAALGDGTVVEYCVDVSARKRAEAERDLFFTLAQDLLGVASMRDGRWTRVNAAMTRVLGWSEAELLATSFLDLVHPEDRDRSAAALARMARGERPGDLLEHRVRCKGGSYRSIAWKASFDADTGLLYCAGRDVTEQRRDERSQRESEEQARLLIDGVHDFAMFMMDPSGRITTWNAGAQRMLGFSEAEAVGQDGAIIFTPEDRAANAPRQEQDRAATTGKALDERWHIKKDGTRFWGSGVLNVVRNPADGSLRGFVKVLRDETARREAEEALQSAKDAAELANRTKDEFLATLSHELRTPLASILIWSKLLQRHADPLPEYAEGLDAITRSAEAQKQLIDDLLDTSRITAGKLRLDMRLVDLAPLVRSAVESVRPTAEAKGVTVAMDMASDVGVMRADPDRLRQVVWNLLTNAVKFTPDDSGRVDVSLRRRGRAVEIRVSDNGKGIDPEFLPHVFEPFRQAESTTTRVHGGLGLGLAICKQLVEQHGGTIMVESRGLDHGATFIVRLPLPQVRASHPANGPAGTGPAGGVGTIAGPAGAEPLTAWGEGTLRGARVLLVEDESETRAALLRLLMEAGADVTAVPSAAAAMEAFDRLPPHLLVSDIGMPGEDGYSLIRRIRASKGAHGRVPAVALTAFARVEDRDQALAAGFDRHLGKPVEPGQLLATLCELLGEQGPNSG